MRATVVLTAAALALVSGSTAATASSASDQLLRQQTRTINRAVAEQARQAQYRATTTANVRAQPSTGAPVVGRLTAGAAVEVAATENGWHRVTVDGREGFVRQDLLAQR